MKFLILKKNIVTIKFWLKIIGNTPIGTKFWIFWKFCFFHRTHRKTITKLKLNRVFGKKILNPSL